MPVPVPVPASARSAPALWPSRGHTGYAAERGVDLRTVELDVLSQESADAAIATIIAERSRPDVLTARPLAERRPCAEISGPDRSAHRHRAAPAVAGGKGFNGPSAFAFALADDRVALMPITG